MVSESLAGCLVSDKELMGRNEYARHQGVAPNAVTKAIQSGRIARAVVWVNGRFSSIRWRLADELWKENTDPDQAWRTRRGPGPVAGTPPSAAQSTPVASDEQLQRALGRALAGGLVGWAGMLVHRHSILPESAVSMLEDLHLALAVAVAQELGADPERSRLLSVGDLQAARSTEGRPGLLEHVRTAALAFRAENSAKRD